MLWQFDSIDKTIKRFSPLASIEKCQAAACAHLVEHSEHLVVNTALSTMVLPMCRPICLCSFLCLRERQRDGEEKK